MESGRDRGRLNPVNGGNTLTGNSGGNVQISKSFQRPKKVGNRGEVKWMGGQRESGVAAGAILTFNL